MRRIGPPPGGLVLALGLLQRGLAFPFKAAVLLLLSAYKAVLSPLLPAACRFEPTCSVYASEAVARHGVLKGLWLAACRLARCRPGGGGGYDPVPPPSRRATDCSCGEGGSGPSRS